MFKTLKTSLLMRKNMKTKNRTWMAKLWLQDLRLPTNSYGLLHVVGNDSIWSNTKKNCEVKTEIVWGRHTVVIPFQGTISIWDDSFRSERGLCTRKTAHLIYLQINHSQKLIYIYIYMKKKNLARDSLLTQPHTSTPRHERRQEAEDQSNGKYQTQACTSWSHTCPTGWKKTVTWWWL